MTPEEEQKLRNFRLLGGGSSMEPSQQQQDIAPLLGQAGGSDGQGISPEAIAGLGLGGSFYANQIAQNTAARQGFQLVGSPQTTSTAGRLIGSTPAQYTGPAPARPVSGTQMVPTGQAPAVSSTGGSPAVRPAQVTSVRTVPQGGSLALLNKPSALARGAGPIAIYSLADLGVIALDVRSNLFQAYVDSKNPTDRAELKKKIDINMKYGAMYDGLEYMRNEKIVKIEDFNISYEQAESDAHARFNHKFVVERAVKADKKEKPKRAVIILVSTLAAFFIGLFSLLLWEKYNELRAS